MLSRIEIVNRVLADAPRSVPNASVTADATAVRRMRLDEDALEPLRCVVLVVCMRSSRGGVWWWLYRCTRAVEVCWCWLEVLCTSRYSAATAKFLFPVLNKVKASGEHSCVPP